METLDINRRIVNIIAKQLDVDEVFLLPDTRLQEDLSTSSLDKVEMLIAIEREFNIFINDEEAQSLVTINDLVEIVQKKIDK